MSAQSPPDWDHRRATLGKGQWALEEMLAGRDLGSVRLSAVGREADSVEGERSERQEGTEREEPGLREEARRGWRRQQRASGEEQDGGESEKQEDASLCNAREAVCCP